ncbi:ATP-binding cassette domain-containing protein [Candidatus Hepatincola sp. Av]
MSFIQVKNVCKIYKQGKIENYALNNISFDVPKEKVIVLYGPSGSGKTTMLNIIGSLDSATSGSVLVNGEDITKKSSSELARFRLENLGFIFQSYNLFPVLSALENVGLSLELRGIKKDEIHVRALQALADMGIAEFANRKPKDMSGGQQQRVAVARALVAKPNLILGDEPTANLDSKNSESLIALLKEMQVKYKTTVVIASHDEMVINQADMKIKLKDGQISSIN